MRLTDEQKKLVEDNHNLIYWYTSNRGLNLDDYYDLLAIELCNTVVNYDDSKGSLSNYFKLRSDWVISRHYRSIKAKKRDTILVDLTENHNSVDDTDDIVDKLNFLDWMDSVDSEVLKLKYKGYSQVEIAEIMKVSPSRVSKIMKRLKKVFYENYRQSNE